MYHAKPVLPRVPTYSMTHFGNSVCDPIRAILDASGDAVLAVVADVNGPSYRPVGATMAIELVTDDNQHLTGSLSSGCIESDIALHSMRVLASGRPETIRYGKGSPYIDIQLPCGGGLDILLLPRPDKETLSDIVRRYDKRQACTLCIDVNSGQLSIAQTTKLETGDSRLCVPIDPEIAFHVFGKGPEASTFAALVHSAGYPGTLVSPDRETLEKTRQTGFATREISRREYPRDLDVDARTAVVLFFHDHDWEPPLLRDALQSPAFYIGSQGSRQARDNRLQELIALKIDDSQLQRIRGPIGLIPSARDPGTLAVSVLAEVLQAAMPGRS